MFQSMEPCKRNNLSQDVGGRLDHPLQVCEYLQAGDTTENPKINSAAGGGGAWHVCGCGVWVFAEDKPRRPRRGPQSEFAIPSSPHSSLGGQPCQHVVVFPTFDSTHREHLTGILFLPCFSSSDHLMGFCRSAVARPSHAISRTHSLGRPVLDLTCYTDASKSGYFEEAKRISPIV